MKDLWGKTKCFSLFLDLIFNSTMRQFAESPREKLLMQAYICFCLFQSSHGIILVWILSWAFLIHNRVWISSLSLWKVAKTHNSGNKNPIDKPT